MIMMDGAQLELNDVAHVSNKMDSRIGSLSAQVKDMANKDYECVINKQVHMCGIWDDEFSVQSQKGERVHVEVVVNYAHTHKYA